MLTSRGGSVMLAPEQAKVESSRLRISIKG
jgi:hypothetical protein